MKQFIIYILGLVFLTSSDFQINAQEEKWLGNWSGNLEISSTKLNIIFKISQDESVKPIAKMDVPMQGAKDFQTNVVKVETDSLILSVPTILGSFKGAFINDTTILGEWNKVELYYLTLSSNGAKKAANSAKTISLYRRRSGL